MWQGILKKVFSVRDKVALNLSGEGDAEKPFIEHLEDLRSMIVRIVTTLAVSTIGTFVFYQELFKIILYPLVLAGLCKDMEEARSYLVNIGVAGPFMMAINVSLITAVIISFPILLIFTLMPILALLTGILSFPLEIVPTVIFLMIYLFSVGVYMFFAANLKSDLMDEIRGRQPIS